MNTTEFQVQGVSDPRLAVYATSALPAWLWSTDGTRLLWANPVGADLFGAAHAAQLAKRTFGPADAQRRQVAQLAGKLPPNGAIRLERLRGFGARPGMLVTCACARLGFADGSNGILIAPIGSSHRAIPLLERLRRLVDGVDARLAAFATDGMFVAASDAARVLLGFRHLTDAGLDQARMQALATGRAETTLGIGRVMLHRVGGGADVGLVAVIEPRREPRKDEASDEAAMPAAPVALPAERSPAYEQMPQSGEAPAEFAMIDAFTDGEPSPPAPHAEAAQSQLQAEAPAGDMEPSPYVEPVADEPASAADSLAPEQSAAVRVAPPPTAASWLDHPAPEPRRRPLRFVWQMDSEARFSTNSEEFVELTGPLTASMLGRTWSDIAETLGLDPDSRVLQAFATHDTWSGITLNWPVDGGGGLPVELAGLPVFDRARSFAGFRGFGMCRDLDALARLAAFRRCEHAQDHHEHEEPGAQESGEDRDTHHRRAQALSADIVSTRSWHGSAAVPPAAPDVIGSAPDEGAVSMADDISPPTDSPPTDLDIEVKAPPNVVLFRPLGGEPKSSVLTPVENSAFTELARQLSARLERDNAPVPALTPPPDKVAAMVEPPGTEMPEPAREQPATLQPATVQPEWLIPPEPPARGESKRDRALLDLLPTGVLIYRLDRLLYANPAFLQRMGYPSLHALEQAGGLDALYVEPGVSRASSTSEAGKPVRILATEPEAEHDAPSDARLFTILWDGDSALALMFTPGQSAASPMPVSTPSPPPPVFATAPAAPGHANAEDLAAILDTTTEGVLMFDASGSIHACNRSAEALFGCDGTELVERNLVTLFAPESQRVVQEYLESIKDPSAGSLPDAGRDVLGRVEKGGIIPLFMTMGRTRLDGPNFFAVFRDQPQDNKDVKREIKKDDGQLRGTRSLADRAASAKADMLARISHEVRTPLNAIIGFSEVMIAERFGPLGNERYAEYLKDIRASGERVVAIIDDLLELSRIETGKLDLAFTSQNLNELVESCVAVMQPQANRERIIIRTSLAHLLPPVLADAHALRQITINLIGNSIHLANPGGQVIVSTALSDHGEVVLRVRDTGHGLNDNEVAAALEPFCSLPPSDRADDHSPVNLSLTKALVEANRAQLRIKTGGRSGTLVEVVFARALAWA